jgi:hypothetical protein
MHRLLPVLVFLWLSPVLSPGASAQAITPLGTPPALDEETLQGLTIVGFAPGAEPEVSVVGTLGTIIGLPPGGTVVLVLGVIDREICGFGIRCFVPVDVAATWSVTPPDDAWIDPTSGHLTIDPSAPGGSRLTVRAEIEGGRRVVSTNVTIVTPASNPLVGYWQEVTQVPCQPGADIIPELPIQEFVLAADGSFAVTWTPFESYVDYWGDYTFDLTANTLELIVTGGNSVPADFDGQGQFMVDADGYLVLTEMWLGTPRSGTTPPHCGHRFA